ncbi:ras guanine nucleotide exchange factor P [Biomphalaria pfeifferi]|uniref:Ras guanine nucleotide exchange factor P n=1 Tax=Biomphalaria pfeifferi TaxID=112525 RepID=A0AAD8BZU2_BIOPF|nr:ras guanine nucleotide exchange factor P [Biomphalaria pfeifferi]
MSSETVYVAIGIACVVAVLLFIVFIIYCVKRHNDKLYNRQARERRQREERHRRHLMMGHLVRPPPYDPNVPSLTLPFNRDLPFSPPPAYKEVATPMPRNGTIVGLGDLPYGPPVYDYPNDDVIPTVSSRVPNSYYNSYRGNGYDYSNNRTTNMNRINSLHVRPLTSPSAPMIVLPPETNRDRPTYFSDSQNREITLANRREVTGENNRNMVRQSGDDTHDQRGQQRSDVSPQLSFSPEAVLAHSYNSGGGPPSSRVHRDSNNNAGYSTSRSVYNSSAPAPPNTLSGNALSSLQRR